MNSIFHKYLDEYLTIYLDVILIYSRNEGEHFNHIKLVLQLLRDNHLYINKAKGDFSCCYIQRHSDRRK